MSAIARKRKRPQPQFKTILNIPLHELADHLTVLCADGYTEWTIIAGPAHETHRQHPPDADGIVRTEIDEHSLTVNLLVYWECDSDDDDDSLES